MQKKHFNKNVVFVLTEFLAGLQFVSNPIQEAIV